VTVADAAAMLGLSRTAFDARLKDGSLVRLGLIEVNRLGKRRFFEAKSLEAVLFRRRTGGLRRSA
jgi:hypothetical protein